MVSVEGKKRVGNKNATGRPPAGNKTFESKRLYKLMIAERNLTTKQVAEKTGRTSQSIANKLSRDSFSFSEFVTLAKAIGFTVQVCDDETGKVFE